MIEWVLITGRILVIRWLLLDWLRLCLVVVIDVPCMLMVKIEVRLWLVGIPVVSSRIIIGILWRILWLIVPVVLVSVSIRIVLMLIIASMIIVVILVVIARCRV